MLCIVTLTPPFFCRSGGNVTDVKKNLYDGEYHKYSFLWTSEYYVFYVDGEAVWANSLKLASSRKIGICGVISEFL